MPRWKIDIEEKAKPEDIRYVVGKLEAFNDAHTPAPFERREIRLFVRDDAGAIQAGLLGALSMHCLVIQIIWVEEALRGQGIGKELIESAVGIARKEGARQAIVETTTFQAPDFYQKLGFSVICEITDCPLGASSLLMQKWL
jgi:GNAT superfamily N-acetyltransferase